jgi:hypothetical protein
MSITGLVEDRLPAPALETNAFDGGERTEKPAVYTNDEVSVCWRATFCPALRNTKACICWN